MNPPEQAPALRQIYEARRELVRQNEVEISDLKCRLERATRRHDELVAQMTVAKTNYEEAASKIVDLLDENEVNGDDDYNELRGNESKHCPPGNRVRKASERKKLRRTQEHKDCDEDDAKPSAVQQYKIFPSRVASPLKQTPSNYAKNMNMMMKNEVVDLVDSDDSESNSVNNDDGCSRDVSENTHSGGDESNENERRTKGSIDSAGSSQDKGSAKYATKRSRSSSTTSTKAKNHNEDDCDRGGPKRAKSLSPKGNTSINSHGKDGDSNEKPCTTSPTENTRNQRLANGSDQELSPTSRRPRSSSPSSNSRSSSHEGKSVGAQRKRGSASLKSSSSSSASTRRIRLRSRPRDIPPERWLKSSIGRTREELNKIDDMVQYMGSCQFGQSVVVSKFGKVHAIVLNDEWNALSQRNDEYQFWYVGLGPGRKRDARLVGASQSTIPIFHAPKVEYTTRELFYVGHYKVVNLEEFDPPIVEMEKERDMRVTLAFDEFDEQLDSIIKKGPNIGGSTEHFG